MRRYQDQYTTDEQRARRVTRAVMDAFLVMMLYIVGFALIAWIAYEGYMNGWVMEENRRKLFKTEF